MNQKALGLLVTILILAAIFATGIGSCYDISAKSGEKVKKEDVREERGEQVIYPSNLEESAEWRAAIFEYYYGFWGGELPEVDRGVCETSYGEILP